MERKREIRKKRRERVKRGKEKKTEKEEEDAEEKEANHLSISISLSNLLLLSFFSLCFRAYKLEPRGAYRLASPPYGLHRYVVRCGLIIISRFLFKFPLKLTRI